jgi:hypothetical protein
VKSFKAPSARRIANMPELATATDQQQDEELKLSIATHEAGHAVAAALEGLYVYGMRMSGTGGVASHAPAADPEAAARISASGHAAEELFLGRIWHDPLDEVEGGDFSKYRESYPHLDLKEAGQTYLALIADQKERLREHEEVLAALVNELMEALEFEDGIVQGGVAAEILIDIPAFAQMMAKEGLLEAVQARAEWRRP